MKRPPLLAHDKSDALMMVWLRLDEAQRQQLAVLATWLWRSTLRPTGRRAGRASQSRTAKVKGRRRAS